MSRPTFITDTEVITVVSSNTYQRLYDTILVSLAVIISLEGHCRHKNRYTRPLSPDIGPDVCGSDVPTSHVYGP